MLIFGYKLFVSNESSSSANGVDMFMSKLPKEYYLAKEWRLVNTLVDPDLTISHYQNREGLLSCGPVYVRESP